MSLSITDFPAFFEAVHGYEPFPWQTMLTKRVYERANEEHPWPRGIDLPTASGKTACLDIALFTLALSVGNHGRPSLPRRIFFVVDRRIVVDAAHERAATLKRKLEEAIENPQDAIVHEVAKRLRQLGCSDAPLHVSRQRGGVLRDNDWALDPTQPAIITGTVDQIGSRLLFRGYGPGRLSQSVHAALVATDSLILLDEAHCAQPFMQTAEWVRRYAGEDWCGCDEPIAPPLQFVVLSATLPEGIKKEHRFPAIEQERLAALDHPVLHKRIIAPKPAELVVASKTPPKPKESEPGVGPLTDAGKSDHLVAHAADLAVKYAIDRGRRRIAVMVNRVATAAAIFEQLVAETKRMDERVRAHIVLLTGRMRPIDRDELIEKWSVCLQTNAKASPWPALILVTTQCLEVGADFDFDALVTECASLDALRQRFGRLNRLGDFPETDAAVLHRKKPGRKHEDDPIYGQALDTTWAWLNEHAEQKRFDFGIAALERTLPDDRSERDELLKQLNAPSLDAPILMPAHVDLLCQTAPRPALDPDASLYLHGVGRGVPEARVVFRADLVWDDSLGDDENRQRWLDAVSLVRPVSGEMLTVPLFRLRRWLVREDRTSREDSTGDIEGQLADREDEARLHPSTRFVRWQGAKRSEVLDDPNKVMSNDIVVVPADEEDAKRLAHYFNRPEGSPLDAAEHAYPTACGHAVLRINDPVLNHAKAAEPVKELLEYVNERGQNEEDPERDELMVLLRAVAEYSPGQAGGERLPQWQWLRTVAGNCRKLAAGRRWCQPHPMGGFVVRSAPIRNSAGAEGLDEFADEDDTRSELERKVSLDCHASHVVSHAKAFAERLLPALADIFGLAARLHDVGKADERFQAYLRNDPLGLAPEGELLAKSAEMPRTPAARARLRRQVELPDHFRHEMLSAALAEHWSGLPADPLRRDLILHLIASHHGHARPFAPVCIDEDPPRVQLTLDGAELAISPEQRAECPAHRLDSGVPERYWRLTRRYGWWGLAYLEAILRLADWRASAEEQQAADGDTHELARDPQEALS